jgi:hypothetical protein
MKTDLKPIEIQKPGIYPEGTDSGTSGGNIMMYKMGL